MSKGMWIGGHLYDKFVTGAVSCCTDVSKSVMCAGKVLKWRSRRRFKRASALLPSLVSASEEIIFFFDFEGRDPSSTFSGQQKFTGDPGPGPSLTHLRQSWVATEVDLELNPAKC